MDMPDIKALATQITSWEKRRIYVAWLLIFHGVLGTSATAAAVWLSFSAHFGVFIACFLLVVYILTEVAILLIAGTYLFGATWENANFLKIIPDLIPHFMSKEDAPPNEKD
jgi:hypothetical protein